MSDSTPQMILHHYPNSPFSEKVRLMMGLKGLRWGSVFAPDIAPKPDLVALTGGYRRIPVLQVGADIYCDTALIADVIEHVAPAPGLYPAQQRGLAHIVAQWADDKLFWAAMGYNFTGAAEMFKAQAPHEAAAAQRMQAFADDRSRMFVNMTRLRPADATSAYRSYLRRLATLLDDGQPYLLGDAPTVADLAAYAPLWFTRTRVPALAGILAATPSITPWMDRVAAIGHGTPVPMGADEAILIANRSEPASVAHDTFQDDHRLALGTRVSVCAESFGGEVTTGDLMAATRTQVTLRRHDERAGTVFVHFPRVGYSLRKADTP